MKNILFIKLSGLILTAWSFFCLSLSKGPKACVNEVEEAMSDRFTSLPSKVCIINKHRTQNCSMLQINVFLRSYNCLLSRDVLQSPCSEEILSTVGLIQFV